MHEFNTSTVLVRYLNMKFHSDTFHCVLMLLCLWVLSFRSPFCSVSCDAWPLGVRDVLLCVRPSRPRSSPCPPSFIWIPRCCYQRPSILGWSYHMTAPLPFQISCSLCDSPCVDYPAQFLVRDAAPSFQLKSIDPPFHLLLTGVQGLLMSCREGPRLTPVEQGW